MRALPAENWAYLQAAGTGATYRANLQAMEAVRIVPRMLRNVETRDLGVTLFDRRLPSPVLLAPIGVQSLAHADADLATARAAAARGVPMVFSNQASVTMERCAEAMGDCPRWLQLYWTRSDDLVRSLVQRAEACGCEAIVVTLDTTMLGWRPSDLDAGFLPFLRGRRPGAIHLRPGVPRDAGALAGGRSDGGRAAFSPPSIRTRRWTGTGCGASGHGRGCRCCSRVSSIRTTPHARPRRGGTG